MFDSVDTVFDELIIDLGTYSYGPGGHIIGFGISSKF